MKILVINGVNLNMLGIREPQLYGARSYRELSDYIKAQAKQMKLKVKVVQSNYEGKIVDYIQKAYRRYDGIVINAGAYTHTSIAILDALKAIGLPTAEVHLTDVGAREDYRKISFISEYAAVKVIGKGFEGYKEALKLLTEVIADA